MKRQLYFAYGSNMDRDQMRFRCPRAQFLKTVKLSGFKFQISARHYATVVEDPSSEVYGVLWNLSEECEESLDFYEGVSSGLYEKVYLDFSECNLQNVLIYIDRTVELGKPKAGYLEKIIEASEQLGFSGEYLRGLESFRNECKDFLI